MIRFSVRTHITRCTISFAGSSDGDNAPDDFQGPQTSGGGDTANAPYAPPDAPPEITATPDTFNNDSPFPSDTSQSDNSPPSDPDFQGAPSDEGTDTANVPYTPPDPPPQPTMGPGSGSDGDDPDAPEHNPEDTSTVDSIGEGQDEETPEPPGI